MKKLILSLFLICLSFILLNPQDIYNVFNNSLKICFFNLFPSLFPFLVISNLMTNYGFIDICNKYGKWIMNKLFKINSSGFYVLFLSMLSGSPSNAKYIKHLLDKKIIDINDANNLLKFTHFINPLFIIGGIGLKLLNNKSLGIIILISHYIGGLIIGIIQRKEYNPINCPDIEQNNSSFIENFSTAIKDTIDTLVLILGIITSCFILSTIIHNLTNIPNFLFGLIEITSGINYTIFTRIPLIYKIIIISFFLSFGGLSIHMQVLSILNQYNIKYLPYLSSRIIHSILSCLITTLLFLVYHQGDIPL